MGEHHQSNLRRSELDSLTWGTRMPQQKGFIRTLLIPGPSRRRTAEQPLAHSWVTSFAVPIGHDLSGLGETFDSPSRARWRNAISAARVLTRFGNHKGTNNHKDKSVVSSDDEDDGGGRRVDVVACDAIHGQRQLSPSSPNDRVPRRGLTGFVAAELKGQQ